MEDIVQLVTSSRGDSPGEPCAEYLEYLPVWRRVRAVLGGERTAKEHDRVLDLATFSNLLIPFSPTMSAEQYRWYLAEAELPGVSAQYARVLLGGLLRKAPVVNFEGPEGALEWIRHDFMGEGRPLSTFMDEAVYEEILTRRNWAILDWVGDEFSHEIQVVPQVWRAEDVINWQTESYGPENKPHLTRLVLRYLEKDYTDNPYHPEFITVLSDLYLDEEGYYTVDLYHQRNSVAEFSQGNLRPNLESSGAGDWELVSSEQPQVRGERLTFIPAWPMSGEVDLRPPMLLPLVDKEVALYNKLSRRNHLLYGASTYTPVLRSDSVSPEEFDEIVAQGLGTWIKLGKDDTLDTLTTPTDALSDLDRAIDSTRKELDDLGARLLSPDYAESGIALQLRNAPQTAQLGLLNQRASSTMREIIAVMVSLRYGVDLEPEDVDFNLTEDFNSNLSQDSAGLLTDWYERGFIPRSLWLQRIKEVELIPPDYDDVEGQEELAQDRARYEGYLEGPLEDEV